MNILLTGASGFVGRPLARELSARDHTLWLHSATRPVEELPGSTVVTGDLAEGGGLADVPWEQLDAVVHLAAAGVKAVARQWPACLRANVGGTSRLLEELRTRGLHPTFLYTRSFYEQFVASHPHLLGNPYIGSKYAAGRLVAAADLPLVTATLFQLYGPADHPENIVNHLAAALAAGQPVTLGSGLGRRDWLWIDDAAAALATALERGHGERIEVDIGSGTLHSIREVAETMADLAGAPRALLQFDPARDRGDTELTLAATALVPGWSPHVSLADGLQRMLEAASP